MLATEGSKGQFSLLGLGDIVIPGLFVALMLRYDANRHMLKDKKKGTVQTVETVEIVETVQTDTSNHHTSSAEQNGVINHLPKPYFYSNIVAYALGLSCTVVIMFVFEAAQVGGGGNVVLVDVIMQYIRVVFV